MAQPHSVAQVAYLEPTMAATWEPTRGGYGVPRERVWAVEATAVLPS